MLYPNNKEELKAGRNSLIEWISEPGVGAVKLEYSIDKGTNYYSLQNNLANTGSWHWSVPFENSANFEDFQEKVFPVDGGWTKVFPGEGTDDPGSIFISRDSLRTGKFLKLKAPQPGINIAVKKFSLPERFPFDVSDRSFEIANK